MLAAQKFVCYLCLTQTNVGSWVGPLQTVLLLTMGAVIEMTLNVETEVTGNTLDR